MTEQEVMAGLVDQIEHKDEYAISDRTGVIYGLEYLRAFGYLAHKSPRELTLGDIYESLLQFQTFAGVQNSGHLDIKTVQAMTRPRCGVPDLHPMRMQAKDGKTPKKDQWNKRKLTYAFEKFVPGLSYADQGDILELVCKNWSDVVDMTFTRINDCTSADILLGVGRGKKDDFDGPSGTLAWAYLPTGDDSQLTLKFDLDEVWVKDVTERGILMLNVGTHEFGHLLGLDHSAVESALMAPFYNPAVAKPQENDDIPRIRALYGPEYIAPVEIKPTMPRTLKYKVSGEIIVTLDQ